MRLQTPVELVEHDARLDDAAPRRDIEREELRQVLRTVDHETLVDRLPAIARCPRRAP